MNPHNQPRTNNAFNNMKGPNNPNGNLPNNSTGGYNYPSLNSNPGPYNLDKIYNPGNFNAYYNNFNTKQQEKNIIQPLNYERCMSGKNIQAQLKPTIIQPLQQGPPQSYSKTDTMSNPQQVNEPMQIINEAMKQPTEILKTNAMAPNVQNHTFSKTQQIPTSQTKPQITSQTKPQIVQQTKPSQTQPSQTQPSQTQPSQTQPSQTQPSQTQPSQTQAPQIGPKAPNTDITKPEVKPSLANRPIKPVSTDEQNTIIEVLPMRNAIGTNSCYINVVVQLLYQAIFFRVSLIQRNPFRASSLNCLKKLLSYYQDTITKSKTPIVAEIIDVSSLRKELSLLFKGYRNNETSNLPGDPVDVFLNIMTIFHAEYLNLPSLSDDNAKSCIPNRCLAHQNFSLKLMETTSCIKCNTFSNHVYDPNYYAYEIYSCEILSEIKTKRLKLNSFHQKLFEIIQRINSTSPPMTSFCPCRDQARIVKSLIALESPVYMMINCTWSVYRPSLLDICNMYAIIPLRANSSCLFEIAKDKHSHWYVLNSMVTFYNGHYTFCFRGNTDKKWYFCDDMTIKTFETWTLLMNYLVKNHYHPQLLCYLQHDKSSLREHISQNDYDILYKHCLESEKKNNNKAQEITNESMLSSFIDRKKSGLFTKESIIFKQESNKQIVENDEGLCSFCHVPIKPNQINCVNCQSTKLNNEKKGNISNNNKQDFDIDQVSLAESLAIGSSPSGSHKKNEVSIKSNENNKECPLFVERSSTNEAETSNEDIMSNIKKKSTKEIMLSQEKGQMHIRMESLKNKKENIKEQFILDNNGKNSLYSSFMQGSTPKEMLMKSYQGQSIPSNTINQGKELICSKCNEKSYEKDLLKQAVTMSLWYCYKCKQQNQF